MIPELNQLSGLNSLFYVNNRSYSGKEFLDAIGKYRQKIHGWQAQSPNTSARVVLFHTDVYEFTVRLFALGLENIDIVLPANGQEETIRELLEGAQGSAGEIESISSIESFDPTSAEPIEPLSWPEGRVFFVTSGSSGAAKLVEKRWCHLLAETKVQIETFGIQSTSHFIATVPHYHVYGLLFRLLLPLAVGGVIYETNLYPEHIVPILHRNKPTYIVTSPAFLNRLASDNVFVGQMEHVRGVFSSGGPLTTDVAVLMYESLGIAITQVYGSTESGGIGHKQVTTKDSPNWTLFTGVKASVESDGRLQIRSPFFPQDRLVLDDVGTPIGSSELQLRGRVDRTLKIEEKRINLNELERWCNTHAWVDETKVISLQQGARTILGAVLKLSGEGLAVRETRTKFQITQTLQGHMRKKFEPVCTPKKWRLTDSLPYTDMGKLPLKNLEGLFDEVK